MTDEPTPYYPIIDIEVDDAGKVRVRVDIDTVTVMFKYDEMPTDEQVQADAAKYQVNASLIAPPGYEPPPLEGV